MLREASQDSHRGHSFYLTTEHCSLECDQIKESAMRSLEPTLSIGLWAGLLPETHMVKRNVAKLEFKSTLDSTKAKTPAMISQLSDTRQKSSGLKVDVCFQRWDCLSRLPGSRKHKGPQGS